MRRVVAPFFLIALVFAGACGDDGGEDEALTEQAEPDEATEEEAPPAEEEEAPAEEEEAADDPVVGGDFCEAFDALTNTFSDVPPNATDEELEELQRDHVRGQIDELEVMLETVPDELRADVEVLIAGREQFLEGANSGDVQENPEFAAATQRVADHAQANCPAA